MLIKNGELLKTSELKEFQHFKKEILPTYSNPVEFRYPRPVAINTTGLKEEPPMFNILMTARVETSDGLEEWAYTETLKRNKEGDYVPAEKSKICHKGELLVPHSNPELCFFLMTKSKQNGSTFIIRDANKEARDKAKNKTLKADFTAILHGSTSPLNDGDTLKDIALAFGVSNVDRKIPEIIKDELESKVLLGEEKKKVDKTAWGIEEFIAKVKNKQGLKQLAVAQKAIDDGLVAYNELSFFFELVDSGDKILRVPSDKLNDRNKYFVNQIVREKDAWAIIKRAVITPEIIDSWADSKDYMWLAEEEGLAKNMKKEDKINALKELYNGSN